MRIFLLSFALFLQWTAVAKGQSCSTEQRALAAFVKSCVSKPVPSLECNAAALTVSGIAAVGVSAVKERVLAKYLSSNIPVDETKVNVFFETRTVGGGQVAGRMLTLGEARSWMAHDTLNKQLRYLFSMFGGDPNATAPDGKNLNFHKEVRAKLVEISKDVDFFKESRGSKYAERMLLGISQKLQRLSTDNTLGPFERKMIARSFGLYSSRLMSNAGKIWNAEKIIEDSKTKVAQGEADIRRSGKLAVGGALALPLVALWGITALGQSEEEMAIANSSKAHLEELNRFACEEARIVLAPFEVAEAEAATSPKSRETTPTKASE